MSDLYWLTDARMFPEPADKDSGIDTLMVDSTQFKCHRSDMPFHPDYAVARIQPRAISTPLVALTFPDIVRRQSMGTLTLRATP